MTTSTHLHWYDPLCADAGIEDIADITSYLHFLDRTAVLNLGLILGLDYNQLKAVMDPNLSPRHASWVATEGGPCAKKRLVESLKDPRVGQTGLASNIEHAGQARCIIQA